MTNEKLEVFIQNLRCENLHRETLIHLENCMREKKILETLKDGYNGLMKSINSSEKMIIDNYIEQIQKVAFAEQQEAYLQGMIDAFQILSGLGILSTNENILSIIEKIKNDASN